MEALLPIIGLLWLAFIIYVDKKRFEERFPDVVIVPEAEPKPKTIMEEHREAMARFREAITKSRIEAIEETETKPRIDNYRQKYLDYLQSPEWHAVSLAIKKRDNFTCQSCGSTSNLQTHHITYKNLFNEPDEDLICVCQPCHSILHLHYGKNTGNYPLLQHIVA